MRKYYQTRISSIYWCARIQVGFRRMRDPSNVYIPVWYVSEMKRTVESFNRKLTERQLLDNSRETQRSWKHNNLCRFHCAFLLTIHRPERIICRLTKKTIHNWLISNLSNTNTEFLCGRYIWFVRHHVILKFEEEKAFLACL